MRERARRAARVLLLLCLPGGLRHLSQGGGPPRVVVATGTGVPEAALARFYSRTHGPKAMTPVTDPGALPASPATCRTARQTFSRLPARARAPHPPGRYRAC